MAKLHFILASQSPRRRELLAEAGYDFEVVRPPVDEPARLGPGQSPTHTAEALAYFKAASVQRLRPASLVVGADTVVALGDELLGKPADARDARRMLSMLSGTRHRVITGLAMLLPPRPNGLPGRRLLASEVTCVSMRPITADELDEYVARGEWRDKAGAYAIQETADRFITRLEGSWSNVVGLPTELLEQMLAQAGIREE